MLNNYALFLGFGLGTMLISEGARLKGSRFSNSLYAYGILDEGYVFLYLYMLLCSQFILSWSCIPYVCALHFSYKLNMSAEEAAELAWRAFITQYSVTELVVAVFLVVCILFLSFYPDICFVHSISTIQHACRFVKHLAIYIFLLKSHT